jgi:hypothetical protein
MFSIKTLGLGVAVGVLAFGVAVAPAAIMVTNTGTAQVVDNGDHSATVSNWALNGGNAVVVYFAGENAKSLSDATYGTQDMTVVELTDGGRWAAAIAYIINPTASTADIVLTWTGRGKQTRVRASADQSEQCGFGRRLQVDRFRQSEL